MPIITDLFYLPPIEYFVPIIGHDMIIYDLDESYQKQTYRNRATINLANKIETISVPVLGSNKKQLYRDVRIDYSQKWKNVHLRGLSSAYGKAPFYEYFFPYFEQVYDKNVTFLMELNHSLLTVCLKLLKLNVKVSAESFENQQPRCTDIRGNIQTKQDFNTRSYYHPHAYPQLFGVDFVPNLSILDLLFCTGPESRDILLKSQKKSLNNP